MRRIIFILLTIFCFHPISAQSSEYLIQSKMPEYRLAPQSRDIQRLESLIQRLSPTESLESIYRYPWPVLSSPEDKFTMVKSALGRISKLQDLIYGPESGEPGKPVFYDAHLIASPENLQRLPDLAYDEIQDSMVLYARLINGGKDEVIVKMTLNVGETITITVENVTPMRLFFVTLVDVGNLVFGMDIDIQGENLELYAVGGIKTFNIGLLRPAVRQRLRDFSVAIVDWFWGGVQFTIASQ